MNLVGYLLHNWWHYSRRTLNALDALSIKFCSRADYKAMKVPSLNEARLSSLHRPTSLISEMIALNVDGVQDAELILAGHYQIFGIKIIAAGCFPDWHKDYLSGYRFDVKPYLNYVISENTGADIIVPWELSRLSFVPSLISAYRTTGDKKYANFFFKVLEDWEEKNPYLHGINWMSGLDVSIRAFNMALGLVYFGDSGEERDEKVARLLWVHLRYLQKRDLYQSKDTVNNHQLVAAVLHYGLLHLFEGGKVNEWRRRAYDIIGREVSLQFHDDGGNYESAILYHQFVLESLYASLSLLCNDQEALPLNDGSILPASFAKALFKATEFSANYARVWKAAPQIGDSSDGRIFYHRGYFSWSPSDYTYLSDWSARVLKERDPFSLTPGMPEARVFEKSGLGSILTERYGALFCVMPVSQRAAGHNHMDKASLIFRVGETPVMVDAGTFCYTSDTALRAVHRSGKGHNVLLVNHVDQAALDGSGTFSAPLFGETGIALGTEDIRDGEEAVFHLWHDGYRRFAGIGRVEREVQCLPDGLRIRDRVNGQGKIFVELVFNLHPNLEALQEENRIHVLSNNLSRCTITCEKGWDIVLEQGWYSASYGSRQKNTRLVVTASRQLPVETITNIVII
jgi:hypothetical protein